MASRVASRVLEIARRNGRAPDQKFPVFRDTELTIGEGLPQAAGLCVADPTESYAAALRGAIGADERDADELEEPALSSAAWRRHHRKYT